MGHQVRTDGMVVDPPRGEEYWVSANAEFQHATDLVRYIREKHGDTFCIGVAGTSLDLLSLDGSYWY